MIERMGEGAGSSLGSRAIGDITEDDYVVLAGEAQGAIDREGSVALLIDLDRFEGEGPAARGSDLRFGHE